MAEPTADDYRRTDRMGRRKPHMIGTALGWLALIPGAADRIRNVPPQGIAEDHETSVLLNCPCGRHPVLDREGLSDFQKCPGCERWYMAHLDRVLVVYGDMPIPAGITQAQDATQP